MPLKRGREAAEAEDETGQRRRGEVTPQVFTRRDDGDEEEELDGGTVAPPKHTDDDDEEELDGGVVGPLEAQPNMDQSASNADSARIASDDAADRGAVPSAAERVGAAAGRGVKRAAEDEPEGDPASTAPLLKCHLALGREQAARRGDTPSIMRRDDRSRSRSRSRSNDEEELDGGTVAPPKHTDDVEEEELDGGVVFAAVPTAAVKAEAANDEDEEEELDGGIMAADLFGLDNPNFEKADVRSQWLPPERVAGGRVTCTKRAVAKRAAPAPAPAPAVAKRAAPAPAPAPAKRAHSMPAPPATREARILTAFEMETGGGDESGFAAAAAQAPPSSAASAFSASMSGGSIAARMMANMGFKAGAGLGREQQGVTAAIDASGQSDTRQGLGFEGLSGQGWNMAQAKAAPLGDEELDPCPKPLWMGSSAEGPPDADTLRRWLVEGPRIESIDNETEHCEPAVLRAMLQRKSALDHIPHDARKAFNDARTRANPFEALKKVSAARTSSDGPPMSL